MYSYLHRFKIRACVAQWSTHLIRNEKIHGSNPCSGCAFCKLPETVYHILTFCCHWMTDLPYCNFLGRIQSKEIWSTELDWFYIQFIHYEETTMILVIGRGLWMRTSCVYTRKNRVEGSFLLYNISPVQKVLQFFR